MALTVMFSGPSSRARARALFGMDNGLRVLSRYPILEHKTIVFQTQDAGMNPSAPKKAFLYVLLQIKNIKTAIINVHLASGLSSSGRYYQLREIVQFISDHSLLDKSDVVIITGDFNMTLTEMNIGNGIKIKGVHDATVSTHVTDRGLDNMFIYSPHHKKTLNIQRVDVFQWVLDGKRDQPISDHYGTKVVLDIE